MNRQAPPAMVKKLPMIILLISSGSRRLTLHHFQNSATATSIEKLRIASSVISQLDGMVYCHELQVEVLVAPDEVGVEDFLIGQQRNRENRDQDAKREDAQPVLAVEVPGQVEIERAHHDDGGDRADQPVGEQDSREISSQATTRAAMPTRPR